MWRNWGLHSLLVGLSNGTATIDKGLEFLQVLCLKLPHDPVILLPDRQTNRWIETKRTYTGCIFYTL